MGNILCCTATTYWG